MGVRAWDTYRRRICQAMEEELQWETCNAGAGFAEAAVGNFIYEIISED